MTVVSGKLLQETVTHSKAFTKKNLIKKLFTEILARLKGFSRDSGHQGSKDGKPLLLLDLRKKQGRKSVPETR